MITTIAAIVIHTPFWVWALYALLMFLGFQRTRDSTVRLWRVLVLPLVVTVLVVSSAVASGLGALPIMVVGFAAGSLVGWELERDGTARRLPGGRIWLRGEWWSFAQLVAVLIFRYATNVVAIMDPALNANWIWHSSTVVMSGALSGLFLGRTASRLRVYFTEPAAA